MNKMKEKRFFYTAKPVWAKDMSEQINICVELECVLKYMPNTKLFITGATFFQIFMNESLIHYGPARAADGIAAVDEINLSERMANKDGNNRLLIRTLGYNCPSFACVSQKSFVCAEVRRGDSIIAATGNCGFVGFVNHRHLRFVERYSFQRHFCESWDLTRKRTECEFEETDCNVKFTERESVYPNIIEIYDDIKCFGGTFASTDNMRTEPFGFVSNPNEAFFRFPKSEIESNAYNEYIKTRVCADKPLDSEVTEISKNECVRWDYNKIQTGFFRIEVTACENSRIVFAFSEQKTKDGQLDMKQLNSHNVIEWRLPKGKHTLWSCEPYTVKYAEVLAFDGVVSVKTPEVYELAFPKGLIKKFEAKDTGENEIYQAAVRTFRHNALDIYMDCPSRERAGWLFDSYYTAKAEYAFTGKSVTEDAFLKNYICGGAIPKGGGMLSMCYPSEVFTKSFIPQWAMWYIIEVNEYVNVRCGKIPSEDFEPSVYNLVDWFSKYENEFGLLERLDGWNFVEWSKVNERVWDISWATNMLYAKALDSAAELMNDNELNKKSKMLRETIRKFAFDGKMFCDRAMRMKDGNIKNTDELSEVTQYYALISDVADIGFPEYDYLKNMVLNVFGSEKFIDENIEKANAMPGLYLRTELLLKYGMKEKLMKEIKEYFGAMARESGTLWEHKNGNGSRNHGFASYVGAVIKEIAEAREK